jgi:hypothetical protein
MNLIHLFPVIVLGILVGMLYGDVNGQDQLTPGADSRFVVHRKVEEKARLLQDNNQDTYRALADEIFNAVHGFEELNVLHGIGPTRIPVTIADMIKDRLVYAEMQYRQGTGKGVTEQGIVTLTNLLAQEMDLPAYARTSRAQVRSTHMTLINYNPTFMGYKALGPDMKVGESINEELSPLQATHLLLEVLGHKLSDPVFQVAPENWEEYTEKVKAWQREALKKSDGQVTYQLIQMDSSKSKEVRNGVASYAKAMTPTEALSLFEKGLDTLGIGR